MAKIEYTVIIIDTLKPVIPNCFSIFGSTGISIEFPKVITKGTLESAHKLIFCFFSIIPPPHSKQITLPAIQLLYPKPFFLQLKYFSKEVHDVEYHNKWILLPNLTELWRVFVVLRGAYIEKIVISPLSTLHITVHDRQY